MSEAHYFIDTSALFKRYINEAGTENIDRLFAKEGSFIISSLTIVEMISNLRRLLDVDGKIDARTFDAIKRELFSDIADGALRVEPVTSGDIIASVELLGKSYISPIDSIQLAMALCLKDSCGSISFVCSDRKLCGMAEKQGLKVIQV